MAVALKLYIETENGVILRIEGDSVLVPTDESERFEAFDALIRSLSALAWIRPRDATEAASNQYCPKTGQSDGRREYGVVVPLRLP